MTPTQYYVRKNKFILLTLMLLPLALFMLPVAISEGEDEVLVFFFIPLLSLICLMGVCIFLPQAFSKNAMLSITDEGIYLRHLPTLAPIFSPWSEIWAVKMENDFMGKEVVVILVRNPQGVLANTNGFIRKNHARNAHKAFGSPLSVYTGNVQVEAIPLYKLIQAEIDKRKSE